MSYSFIVKTNYSKYLFNNSINFKLNLKKYKTYFYNLVSSAQDRK